MKIKIAKILAWPAILILAIVFWKTISILFWPLLIISLSIFIWK